MPPAPEDPQDRRTRILDAARAAFLRFGFERTSMADIAAGAGVSRTALYHYFPGKEDVARAVVEEFTAKTLADAARVLDRSKRRAEERSEIRRLPLRRTATDHFARNGYWSAHCADDPSPGQPSSRFMINARMGSADLATLLRPTFCSPYASLRSPSSGNATSRPIQSAG